MATYDVKSISFRGNTFILKPENATQSAAGLMSAEDKTKLDGVATGATANVVSNSLSDTSTTNALSAAKGKELYDTIATYNIGTLADQSALESALVTLGTSMSVLQFKNVRFAFSSSPTSGIFKDKTGYYIGTFKKSTTNVYALDVQNNGSGGQKGEHITGVYDGSSWTWEDVSDSKLDKSAVSNSLSDTSTTNALSAAQGKTLNDNKVNKLITLTGGTDLNDVTASGFYNTNNHLVNGPIGTDQDSWSHMIVCNGLQIYMLYPPNSRNKTRVFIRWVGNTSWKEIQTTENSGLQPGTTSWTSQQGGSHIFSGYITGSGNYIDVFIPYDVTNISGVTSVTLGSSAEAYTPSGKMSLNNVVASSCYLCLGGIFAEFALPSAVTANTCATLRTTAVTIVAT